MQEWCKGNQVDGQYVDLKIQWKTSSNRIRAINETFPT